MLTLESRVATLERQNRTLRASLLLGAIALVTCGGGGITAQFELVNTNSLVIRDQQEQPKISLSSNGSITFHHATGSAVLDAQTVAKLVAAQESRR